MVDHMGSFQNSISHSTGSRREKGQVYDYTPQGKSPTASTRIANTVNRLQKEMKQMAREMSALHNKA